MTTIPSPFVMTAVARQRQDERLAEAERHRLVKHAARSGADRPQQADWSVVAVVMVALAMLLAAHAATDRGPAQPARLNPLPVERHIASQVLDEHLLAPPAAQQISTAQL